MWNTDKNGRFYLDLIEGEQTILVRYLGYESQNIQNLETEIINPYVLDFQHTGLAEVFSASAAEPLRIENRALGYIILFELHQFSWDPHKQQYILEGLPHFKRLPAPDKETQSRWHTNRELAWKGSQAHLEKAPLSLI